MKIVWGHNHQDLHGLRFVLTGVPGDEENTVQKSRDRVGCACWWRHRKAPSPRRRLVDLIETQEHTPTLPTTPAQSSRWLAKLGQEASVVEQSRVTVAARRKLWLIVSAYNVNICTWVRGRLVLHGSETLGSLTRLCSCQLYTFTHTFICSSTDNISNKGKAVKEMIVESATSARASPSQWPLWDQT